VAHACDYQSRPKEEIKSGLGKERVGAQIRWFIENHQRAWSEKAMKEHCLSVYGTMGADGSLFDIVLEGLRRANGNNNNSNNDGESIHH
jgi:hypothetical protein